MERSWFKNYEAGVPHEIDVNEYKNLADIMENSFS